MTWLTWRQTRAQTLALAAVTLLLAAVFAATGPDLISRYRSDGKDFLALLDLANRYEALYLAGIALLYAAPALIGVFWGAPLVARELEAGTHKLVWTQSISRTRWLSVKLGLAALVAVLAVGGIALAATWWSDPIQRSVINGTNESIFSLPRMYPALFGARGVVPVAYTLFALALGTAVGMVLRKTVFAMAITLIAVVALQVVMPSMIRSHLMPTDTLQIRLSVDNVNGIRGRAPAPGARNETPSFQTFVVSAQRTGAWTMRNRTVQNGAVPATLPAWVEDCLMVKPGGEDSAQTRQRKADACFARLAAEGYRQEVVAHPDSHFWPLQWRESGLVLALAALATGFCFWRIRRDFS